eukprot:PITA_18699
MVRGVSEQNITWEKFQRYFKERYLTERFYDEKAREFHDVRLGQQTMDEFITRFTSLLRYVSYIREEKAKVQRFVSSLPMSMRERIEFENPKIMDEAIRKARICYKQSNEKGEILGKKWVDKKSSKLAGNTKGNRVGDNEGTARPPVQCWRCGGPHYVKNCPQLKGTEQVCQVYEASIVGDIGRSLPRINAALEDRQAEYEPTMVEFEGKLLDLDVTVLIDPGATLSYISPRIVEHCKLQPVKIKEPWLVQLATGAKIWVNAKVKNCPLKIVGQSVTTDLNVFPLGSMLVYSRTMEEHQEHLRVILQTLREHKLYAKFSKCNFFKGQIQYLGHIITKEGIDVDPEKINTIMEWSVPKDVVEIQSFMGLAGYYRWFVEGFFRVAYPITSLQKKGRAFRWTPECQRSFEQLKYFLTTAPILSIADPNKDYVACTDASKEGIGGALT